MATAATRKCTARYRDRTPLFRFFGVVAQLAEQLFCKEKDEGATPFDSTNFAQ